MAPSATEVKPVPVVSLTKGNDNVKTDVTPQEKWVKSTGILDQFESFDVTPVIGREFPNVKLAEWLQAPNADELLRELALTSKFPIRSMATKKAIELIIA